jgi:uncharacterized protein (TIGR03382 family)
MKRLLVVLSLVVGAWMLSPTPQAEAMGWYRSWNGRGQHVGRHGGDSDRGVKGGSAVPELDPGTAGSALVLLLGGVAWLASRRREEDLA